MRHVYICGFIHACIYVGSFMRVYISVCIFNLVVIMENGATDKPDKSAELEELLEKDK